MGSIIIETVTGYYNNSKEKHQIQQDAVSEILRQLPGKGYAGKEGRGGA